MFIIMLKHSRTVHEQTISGARFEPTLALEGRISPVQREALEFLDPRILTTWILTTGTLLKS